MRDNILKKSNCFVFVVLSLFLVNSCDSNAEFDNYKSVDSKWHKDSITTFQFKAVDTTKNYNLYINLRTNNNYPYSNLFLITELNYPNGKALTDTLEYKMAAPSGELLGTGFTDIKENKLWYKGYDTKFKFSEIGDYIINIQHAMRNNGDIYGLTHLDGITEIGFRVEKVQK